MDTQLVKFYSGLIRCYRSDDVGKLWFLSHSGSWATVVPCLLFGDYLTAVLYCCEPSSTLPYALEHEYVFRTSE